MPAPPLPPALPGELRRFTGKAGPLACYVAGNGAPVLLLHSINAAASAYEVKPAFEGIMGTRRAYAPDLPGFGQSDRSPRRYDPRLYTDAVHDAVDLIQAEHGRQPIDALALSLSSEFLARAAAERPDAFRSLTLVTPTGFSRRSAKLRRAPGTTLEIPGFHAFFSAAIWSQAIYDRLVSKKVIRYFLKRTYGSDAVHDDMVEYDWLTSHQPGARNAPLAFLAGRLFSGDIVSVYESLSLPVWVPHATRGDFKDFSGSGWAKAKPNWSLQPHPTGALVHWEQTERFLADWQGFLGRAEAA